MRVRVDIGERRFACAVAADARAQARGLQDHAPLGPREGMLFPFSPPRATTFHMGRVAFPIDLVFADASGRIARIVHAAQPGERTRWSHTVCGAVVEVAGGVCARAGVRVGDVVRVGGRRLGAPTYNLLRSLTDAAPMGDGHFGQDPLQTTPGGAVPHDVGHRFEDHKLPDESFSEAMDGMAPHWEDSSGYDQKSPMMRDPNNEMAPVRMSAQVQVDIAEFAPHILEAAFRAGMQWQPMPADPNQEHLVVGPKTLGLWLHSLGLEDSQRDVVHDVAQSPQGLEAIADAFILAGQAEGSRLLPHNTLELTRGRVA